MTNEADLELVRQLNSATDELQAKALARAIELEAEAAKLREQSNELDNIAKDLKRNIHLGTANAEKGALTNNSPETGPDQDLVCQLAAQATTIRDQALTRATQLRAESLSTYRAALGLERTAHQLRNIAKLEKPQESVYTSHRAREDSLDPDADFSDPGEWDLWET